MVEYIYKWLNIYKCFNTTANDLIQLQMVEYRYRYHLQMVEYIYKCFNTTTNDLIQLQMVEYNYK